MNQKPTAELKIGDRLVEGHGSHNHVNYEFPTVITKITTEQTITGTTLTLKLTQFTPVHLDPKRTAMPIELSVDIPNDIIWTLSEKSTW